MTLHTNLLNFYSRKKLNVHDLFFAQYFNLIKNIIHLQFLNIFHEAEQMTIQIKFLVLLQKLLFFFIIL